MSFGASLGKVQIDFVADDSELQTAAARSKRIMEAMGNQMGVTAHTIRSALRASGAHFQYLAMNIASGGNVVTGLMGGIVGLGYAFKGLIIPVAAAMFALHLLQRVFAANAAEAKRMAEETKKAAEAMEKIREGRRALREGRAALSQPAESEGIEARRKLIKEHEQQMAVEQKERLMRSAAAAEEIKLLERKAQWEKISTSTEDKPFTKKLEKARAAAKQSEDTFQAERGRMLDVIQALEREIQAMKDIEYIQKGALTDLEAQKKILEDNLALEEGREAKLKEVKPARVTAQFLGGTEMWKSVQKSIAEGPSKQYEKEQLRVLKESETVQKQMKTGIDVIGKEIANIKGGATWQ